jgi:hypothetical protein
MQPESFCVALEPKIGKESIKLWIASVGNDQRKERRLSPKKETNEN